MLQAGGETWRDDASNADVSVPRNRVRHEVLPYLQRHFNPSIRQALARVAATVRPDEQALDRDAVAAAASLLERHPEGRVQIDAGRLLALPRPLATRVVVHALTAVAPAMPSRDAVTAVMAVASGHPAAADLSAVRVEHFSGNVVLVRRRSLREPSPFRFELPVPGRVVGPGWTIEAALAGGPQGPPLSDVEGAHIDAATLALPLVVRSRRPGDRLRPLGLGGRKKLQDVLVDRKVNRRERDGVAVVTDAAERIVWVAGHVLSEEFRVTARTTSVIILKFRRV
jgi:tRNA(Ile)-lysidine synthase